MNKCPQCHFEITREGARFCPQCGATLLSEKTTETMPPQEEKETRDTAKTAEVLGYCPHCQASLTKPGQKFCCCCGQKILPEIEGEITNRPKKAETLLKQPLPACPTVLQKQRASWVIPALIVIILLAGGGFAWGYYQGYFLDPEPPQVMITSPADGKEVALQAEEESAKEIIQINSKDNRNLSGVELFLNGVLVKQFKKDESLIYKWPTKEEGKYTFQAFAYDHCGNKNNSKSVTVTITKPEETLLPPSRLTSVKKDDVKELLYKWVDTAREKDLFEHVNCYASQLNKYFKQDNVPLSEVYKEKEDAMSRYDVIEMSIDNIKIDLLSDNFAVAVFNKIWDARGKETFAGEELQRLELKKINGEWKIIREEEVEIYWVIKNGKRIV